MAVRKKTTRRKSTGSKTRKKSSATLKKKIKISGTTFEQTMCGTLAAMRAAALKRRTQGLRARVVKKKSGGACLYVGGRRKRA